MECSRLVDGRLLVKIRERAGADGCEGPIKGIMGPFSTAAGAPPSAVWDPFQLRPAPPQRGKAGHVRL